MKEFDNYWYQVIMCDLDKRIESSNIVTLVFERDVYELSDEGNTIPVSDEEREKLKEGCGLYEIDLDFDYMAIDYEYDGYEYELSKDLQRDHDILCWELHRLPTNEEIKIAIEKHLWGWGEKYQKSFVEIKDI